MSNLDHLFISYAWEDGALAEWLTLKLTAEGYRVWCDRFKVLGGERWPDDVDAAIRNDTFRMLHLVSKHSLRKANPKKERELALQLESKRKSEILIPLNVDGTKPSELPWRIVDIAYIPFQNWSNGMIQLLKKLRAVNAPRPLGENGRSIAASAYFHQSPITGSQETIISNVYPFIRYPSTIRQFRVSAPKVDLRLQDLNELWAFRDIGDGAVLAFTEPPGQTADRLSVTEIAAMPWRERSFIEGVPTRDLMNELLTKSLDVHCRIRGLVGDPGGRGFYFPVGLLDRNTLIFDGVKGRRTRLLVCGSRRFGRQKYRYHLTPWFRIRRDLGVSFAAQLRLRLYLTDVGGVALETRAAVARRKRIGGGWWNKQWLNRQLGVMSYLSSGNHEIRIGQDPDEVVLSTNPLQFSIDRGIDEQYLATIDAPASLMPASVELGEVEDSDLP